MSSVILVNSDNFLSMVALPATNVVPDSKDILEKFFPNLITTPSNNSSLIRTFDPAPNVNIFSLDPNLFIGLDFHYSL